MSASPNEIRRECEAFIAVIENSGLPREEAVAGLRRSLDRLAAIHHDVVYTFDERDYPDPPARDYDTLRQTVVARFPTMGFYNIACMVTRDIANAAVDVGDAIDDIVDIAGELYKVLWRFDHTSTDDALWYFAFSYTAHWEQHLRELQLYSQRLASRQEDSR